MFFYLKFLGNSTLNRYWTSSDLQFYLSKNFALSSHQQDEYYKQPRSVLEPACHVFSLVLTNISEVAASDQQNFLTKSFQFLIGLVESTNGKTIFI